MAKIIIQLLTLQVFSEYFGEEDPFTWKQFLEYSAVALVGSVKFVIGIFMALTAQYSLPEVLLTATLGAFIGVWVFTFFGTQIRNWIDRTFSQASKKKQIKEQPRLMKIWNRFGMTGIAFLAPIISPPVSVGLAVSFREKPYKIILYMGISLLIWSIVFTIFRDALVAIVQKWA